MLLHPMECIIINNHKFNSTSRNRTQPAKSTSYNHIPTYS